MNKESLYDKYPGMHTNNTNYSICYLFSIASFYKMYLPARKSILAYSTI